MEILKTKNTNDNDMIIEQKRDESPSQYVTFSFEQSDFGQNVQAEWKKLFDNRLFSDITLVVGNEKLASHKVVIATWSAPLKELLRKLAPNATILEIEINPEMVKKFGGAERAVQLWKRMLEFFYTGQCPLPESDALALLELANEWQVVPLKESCGLKLWDYEFNEDKNVGFLLDIAQRFGCSLLEFECAKHLAENFDEMLEGKMVFNLPVSTLKQLLKQDNLAAPSEEVLIDTILEFSRQPKFKTHDEKVKVLQELLPYVRYCNMSAKFLVEKVEPLTKDYPFLHEYLFEAYKWKSTADKKMFTPNPFRFGWRSGARFVWDSKKKSPTIKISEDGVSLTHGGQASTWVSARSEVGYSSGVIRWQLKIDNDQSKWLFIGICQSEWIGYNDQGSGYTGRDALSWSCGNYAGWGKTHNSQNSALGKGYTTGDTLEFTLDCDAHTLSLRVNDDDLGPVHTNLPAHKTFHPCVTIYQPGDKVSLLFSAGGKKAKKTKEKSH